jgi:hypothetical protein
MKKLLAFVILIGLVFGGWYFISPWLAMKGIRDAAQDRDLVALEQRVDFDRVREDKNRELRNYIENETREGSAMQRVGGIVFGELTEGAIDATMTPQGIANLVTVGSFAAPLIPERFRGQELEWDVQRDGINHFRGVGAFNDGSFGPVLYFERYGLGWKMTGFELCNTEGPCGRFGYWE